MYGPGLGGMFHILGVIVWGFASLVALAIVVAILALLVRYLLVATRAHKLYIANNTPAVVETPVVAETPVGETVTPVTKPRTPKAPPAL